MSMMPTRLMSGIGDEPRPGSRQEYIDDAPILRLHFGFLLKHRLTAQATFQTAQERIWVCVGKTRATLEISLASRAPNIPTVRSLTSSIFTSANLPIR
jgi:hypothetical protein